MARSKVEAKKLSVHFKESGNGPVSKIEIDDASGPSGPVEWVRRVACCPRQRNTANGSSGGRKVLSTSKVLLGTSTSMDRIGSAKEPDNPRKNIKFEGTFFSSTRSPRKQYFTIHPEWVSENLSVQKMTLQEKCGTYPPRRCKSAPPPRSRNPITWENWTVTPYR